MGRTTSAEGAAVGSRLAVAEAESESRTPLSAVGCPGGDDADGSFRAVTSLARIVSTASSRAYVNSLSMPLDSKPLSS